MKVTQNLFLTVLTLAALTAGAWAQTQTASNVVPANPSPAPAAAPASPPPVTAADVQALKDALAAQQLQIQQLTQQLQRQQALQEAQQAAINAADKAPANPPKQVASLGAEGGNAVNPVQQDATPSQTPNPDDAPQTFNKQMEGPVTIHFRGINITPGGYAAAEFIRRSRALAADIVHPIQLPAHARGFAEQVAGVLRLRPPVEDHYLRRWPSEERRPFQLCLG